MSNQFPPLYGKTSAGKLQVWYTFTEGDAVHVIHGLVDGKKQEKITYAKGKNKGKSNETSDSQQAILEAQSKWQHQRDRGYFETKEEALNFVEFSPMKAQPWKDHSKKITVPCYVQPKLNGCFSYNTMIQTSDGYKKIGDIVSGKLPVKVASFNETTKKVEFKRVTNWFNNGYKPKDEWLLFGNKQRITRSHKVYSDGGWHEAIDVRNAQLYGRNPRFSACVAGMLLGDSVAPIEKRSKSTGVTHGWRLSFSVAKDDLAYGHTKAKLFPEFDWKICDRVSGYGFPQIVFTSSTMSLSPFDLSIFYDLDRSSPNYGKRCKVDVKKLKTVFDVESLLIWYMDDGSLHYNNGNKDTPRMTICVARYDDETVREFAEMFTDLFRVTPSIGLYGVNKVLTFSTPNTLYLMSLLARYSAGMCSRKIPDVFKIDALPPVYQYCQVDSNIGDSYKYGNESASFEAFDIEVEDNHNYFAEGVLVHNCRLMLEAGGKALSKSGLDLELPEHWKSGLRILEACGLLDEGLDGEVYAGLIKDGGLSLQEIISAFRKENENTHKLEYHVYDIPGKGTFEERAQKLGKLHEKLMRLEYEGIKLPIKVVWTGIVEDEVEADTVYDYLVSEGYEGMMYRNAKGLYEHGKRSYDLQKRKPRQTTEAKVVGCTIDKNGDGVLKCSLQSGVEFECLMRKDSHPTINYRKYDNAVNLVGKFIEIEFEEFSDAGVPTKPVGIGIREVNPETWQPLY